MYTNKNYRTKKELKEAVARRIELRDLPNRNPEQDREFSFLTNWLGVYQPNGDITGVSAPTDGRVTLEGPHYPEPHRWYAQAEVAGGVVVKVK